MASTLVSSRPAISRRRFLKTGLFGSAGLALYSGEIERHWIDVTHHAVSLRGLPAAFEGLRITQLSDFHLDEFTEPFFLRHVVECVNQLNPDLIFLTGDYVTFGLAPHKFAKRAAWQCAEILRGLKCRRIYGVLGNHDVLTDPREVTEALATNGITMLCNACLPIEQGGSRIWLAGMDDPVCGQPKPDMALPASIRNVPDEPVVLLCHAPDYADHLLQHPAGQAVAWMLSGHTHGGQVRLPFLEAMALPPLGRKYVEGSFRLGALQLYVNRGLGTVGVPFRFACPPEITLHTLHRDEA